MEKHPISHWLLRPAMRTKLVGFLRLVEVLFHQIFRVAVYTPANPTP